ncbi:MAG: succinate dehydrogenase cytochrome b subunit [Bacteroidales bacterium]|nr:succinate dehydrogenase cytochrome b subunit [Bacteroidales bacterium]
MANLPKVKSITKKLVVALLGAFLIVFLLFHMCANLFILADDGGAAYSAFCHFMGTNFLIKIMEIGLLAALLFHIVITIILWFQNRKARGTVRYHVPTKSKTAKGSKLTIYTGIVILAFLVLHFCNFYFVKTGLVKGESFMVKTEDIMKEQAALQESLSNTLKDLPQEWGMVLRDNMSPEECLKAFEEMPPIDEALLNDTTKMEQAMQLRQQQAMMTQVQDAMPRLKATVKEAEKASKIMNDLNAINPADEYLKGVSSETKAVFKEAGIEVEPDFYQTARGLFANKLYTLIYLLCFVALWLHLRHAFEAAMQTLGLTNYKYHRAIEVIGIAIAWIICLGFTAVPIIVCFL